jgi:hypothetical protein
MSCQDVIFSTVPRLFCSHNNLEISSALKQPPCPTDSSDIIDILCYRILTVFTNNYDDDSDSEPRSDEDMYGKHLTS